MTQEVTIVLGAIVLCILWYFMGKSKGYDIGWMAYGNLINQNSQTSGGTKK